MTRETRADRARNRGFDLVQQLVDSRVGCCEGMHRFLTWASDKPGGSWSKLARIDWSQDLALASVWLAEITRTQRALHKARGIWFQAPEIELNAAHLRLDAYSTFDARDEMLGWACDPTWPRNPEDPRWIYSMRALEQARSATGLGPKFNERAANRESVSTYLLPLAYTGLLVRELLASLPTQRIDACRGAVVGFYGGDWVRVPLKRSPSRRR